MSEFILRLQHLTRKQQAAIAALLVLVGAAVYGLAHVGAANKGNSEVSSQSRKGAQNFTPTPSEWATLTIEPVSEKAFRAEHVTEGKVAVDEDRSTPVFSRSTASPSLRSR